MSYTFIQFISSLVLGTFVIVSAAPSSNLPKDFIQCKKSDPKLNECLRDGLQSGFPQLANGIPSLGIIPIDPLRIVELKIDQNTGHPVNLNLKFSDLDLLNLKYINITNIDYDLANYNAHIEGVLPKSLLLEGDYEIAGKVLVVPITGKGKCKLGIDISKIDINVQFKPVVKNGNTHLDIANLTFNLISTKLNIQLDNLFNGDKALGDNMNVFLNENWREVLNELQPAIEHVFTVVIKDIARHFFDRVPENEIVLA